MARELLLLAGDAEALRLAAERAFDVAGRGGVTHGFAHAMAGGLLVLRDRLHVIERVLMGRINPAAVLSTANQDPSEEGPGSRRAAPCSTARSASSIDIAPPVSFAGHLAAWLPQPACPRPQPWFRGPFSAVRPRAPRLTSFRPSLTACAFRLRASRRLRRTDRVSGPCFRRFPRAGALGEWGPSWSGAARRPACGERAGNPRPEKPPGRFSMDTTSRKPTLQKIPVYEVRLVPARRALRVAESTVSNEELAARTLHAMLGLTDREHFAALFLNCQHRITGAHVVAIGGQQGIGTIEARTVFRAAISACAGAIIMGHNHPSGNPAPSSEDIACTAKLMVAGRILGIPVLDHIIVTRDSRCWYSMHSHGTLPIEAQ